MIEIANTLIKKEVIKQPVHFEVVQGICRTASRIPEW
ncbi:MAG: hypothetical protein ACUVWO_02970 [Thermodesulfobacteriota bacterium]